MVWFVVEFLHPIWYGIFVKGGVGVAKKHIQRYQTLLRIHIGIHCNLHLHLCKALTGAVLIMHIGIAPAMVTLLDVVIYYFLFGKLTPLAFCKL